MKENEAVKRLATALQKRDEATVARAQQLLGDRGTVEAAKDVNYTLQAQELLNAELTRIAFANVMNTGTLYQFDEGEPVFGETNAEGYTDTLATNRRGMSPPLPPVPR